MTDLLKGQNVLVTGAGRNIGRSIALEMAAQGANVYVTDIDGPRLADIEHALRAYPGSSQGFSSDVSDVLHVDRLVEALDTRRVAIDVLVNNVGVQPEHTLRGFDAAMWSSVFATNVIGPTRLTYLIAERMVSRGAGGCVVFLSSIHQWTPRRNPAYSASKAALGMVIQELALELAPHGVRVNGIAPGYVGVDHEERPVPHPPTPLHKASISPCFIGRAAVYLASEYFSARTTGTVLTVDAGLSLSNHLA